MLNICTEFPRPPPTGLGHVGCLVSRPRACLSLSWSPGLSPHWVSLHPSTCGTICLSGEPFQGWRGDPDLTFPVCKMELSDRTPPTTQSPFGGRGQRLGPLWSQTSNRPRLGFATTSLPCDPRLAAALSGHPNTWFPVLDPGRRPPCLLRWAAAEAAVSRQLGRPGWAPEARSGLKCAPGLPAAGGGAAWWEV